MPEMIEQCMLNAYIYTKQNRLTLLKEVVLYSEESSFFVLLANILTYIVILILLSLGFFILLNQHLKPHPYPLYAVIILMRTGNLCRIAVSKYVILLPEIFVVS